MSSLTLDPSEVVRLARALGMRPEGLTAREIVAGVSRAARIAAIDASIERKLSDAWAERCGIEEEPAARRVYADEEEALAAAWVEACGGQLI